MMKRGFGVRLPGLKSLGGRPELITTLGFGSCLHMDRMITTSGASAGGGL